MRATSSCTPGSIRIARDTPAPERRWRRTHIARTNPSLVKKYGSYLWMDPGEKAVRANARCASCWMS